MSEPHPSVEVPVGLQKPTPEAVTVYEKALRDYAQRLDDGAEMQRSSRWPSGYPGRRAEETTAEHVATADLALRRYGERARRTRTETVALIAWTLLSATAGIVGGYLNSGLQWALFSCIAFLSVVCLGYLFWTKTL